MPLSDLIGPDSIVPHLKANGRKQVLQDICERAAHVSGLRAREIFDAIWQREKLGSTGIGNGIAIPHAKMLKCHRLFGVFARLERPVDFESVDGVPVDLIFMLIAPEEAGADHLKALSRIARMMRDPSFVARLRATRDPSGLYLMLAQQPADHAA
jgi:PTS system nitrogen regulatory IIA component